MVNLCSSDLATSPRPVIKSSVSVIPCGQRDSFPPGIAPRRATKGCDQLPGSGGRAAEVAPGYGCEVEARRTWRAAALPSDLRAESWQVEAGILLAPPVPKLVTDSNWTDVRPGSSSWGACRRKIERVSSPNRFRGRWNFGRMLRGRPAGAVPAAAVGSSLPCLASYARGATPWPFRSSHCFDHLSVFR